MTAKNDPIERYFAYAAGSDVEAYVGLFAPGAVIEDDGHSYRGTDAIRAWRATTVPVVYEVEDATSDSADAVARVRVSGGFPGSPVMLTFQFIVDGVGRITSLTIQPAVTS